jgi:hypothetical protein
MDRFNHRRARQHRVFREAKKRVNWVYGWDRARFAFPVEHTGWVRKALTSQNIRWLLRNNNPYTYTVMYVEACDPTTSHSSYLVMHALDSIEEEKEEKAWRWLSA